MGKRGRSKEMQGKWWGNFEGRMNVEIRRQEKLDRIEEKYFRRGELLEKYTAKTLYG